MWDGFVEVEVPESPNVHAYVVPPLPPDTVDVKDTVREEMDIVKETVNVQPFWTHEYPAYVVIDPPPVSTKQF